MSYSCLTITNTIKIDWACFDQYCNTVAGFGMIREELMTECAYIIAVCVQCFAPHTYTTICPRVQRTHQPVAVTLLCVEYYITCADRDSRGVRQ